MTHVSRQSAIELDNKSDECDTHATMPMISGAQDRSIADHSAHGFAGTKNMYANHIHHDPAASPFKFKGNITSYRDIQNPNTWGVGYVDNPNRSRRRRPLHLGTCPFCQIVSDPQDTRPMSLIEFGGTKYVIIENANPIVTGQLLIFPYPTLSSSGFFEHRVDLNGNNVKLIEKLTRDGLSALDYTDFTGHPPILKPYTPDNGDDLYSQPYAVYVNPLPGSGRSVPHLHINCVPAESVPLPKIAPVPWQICQDRQNGSVFSRVAGSNFYGLLIQGENDTAIAETLDRFHEFMNNGSISYNLIAFPCRFSETYSGPRKGWFILGGQLGLHFCKEKRCLYFLI